MNQQPVFGFFLALTAAIMWSILPIALQPVLTAMNAQTIVWFRFVVAMFGVFFILLFTKKLPKPTAFTAKYRWFVLLGVLGLAANFYLYNLSLKYIPATTSQVLSPLSSFSMLLSSIFFFKERLGIHQKLGLGLLLIGLPLFFNDRFGDFVEMNSFSLGVFIGISASLIWVCYGLAQKMMLQRFNSQQILLAIYAGCTLVFTPFANVAQTQNLSTFTLGCLIFCCLNTIIAYGCYAEALNRWEVAKVSMIMPQIPILTIIFSEMAYWFDPTHFAEPYLNTLSYIGAMFVVLGALSAAAGHKLFYRRQLRRNSV
ncbi:DMT family transporter [Ursidibacter sp. B-7004-1]